MRRLTWSILLAVVMMAAALLALDASSPLLAQGDPTATPTTTPTLCPMGTPEPLWVDPVISPTSLLTQTIRAAIGNGEAVTVTTQTGVFTTTGTFSTMNPALVTIDLAPNATNDLTVTARVRQTTLPGGCPAGGYTLQTTRDRNGGPLRIVQQSETATPTPTATATASPTVTPTPTATGTPEYKQYFPYVARIAPGAPDAPQVSVGVVLDGALTLSWPPVDRATGYLVVQATRPDLADAVVLYAGQNTSFSLMPPPGTHYFAVYAVNAVGRTVSNVLSYTPPPPGIRGTVLDNGVPAAGVLVRLRKLGAAGWSTAAQTTTAADGTYVFANVPGLAEGEFYYVLYPNAERNSARLGSRGTARLFSYGPGSGVTYPAFDIKGVSLLSPSDGATVRPPATFAWNRRNLPNDDYAWELFDLTAFDTLYLSDPLGDADTYTLVSRPDGVDLGVQYGWSVLVLGPSGDDTDYGVAYTFRAVTFGERNKLDTNMDAPGQPIPSPERLIERIPARPRR